MHDAYSLFPVIEKLPLKIEAVTGYDGNVLVGTQQGHLLMYSIRSNSEQKVEVNLLRSNKNFSRKPINQVAVIPEHQIIVSLSDNVISVHDLTIFNFPLLTQMSETKGAIAFDIDVKFHTSLTGETKATVRLVVAVRRKLLFYYLKARQFQTLAEEVTLSDNPRIVMWCGEGIAVAFKHDYWLVKLNGEQKELFATGRNQEPLMAKIGTDKLALGRDDKTIFIDDDGKTTFNYTLEWPEQPFAMVYDEPFLIGLLSKGVQIQTQDPNAVIQNITVEKPKTIAITRARNSTQRSHIYVASASYLWSLQFIPITQQVPQLLSQNQFQLALKLVDICEESEDGKKQSKLHIGKLHAFYLFCNGKYQNAMDLFFSLNTDLLFVIGLYPGLVPDEYRSRLQYPSQVPNFSGSKLEEALQALIHFLLQMRHQLVGSHINNSDDNNESPAIKSQQQMLQIVDTTLLKCYLKTNDTLVPSLLRMPDGKVSVEEGERVLRQAHKYPEVVLLLQTRGHHHRALQLLHRHSKRQDSPLFGTKSTINYLQNLGIANIDLIFEYSAWVVKINPTDGLSIFIGDDISSSEVEKLPRPRVLNFLKKTEKSIVIPYLEHVIWEWGESNPLLHNELIHQYRDIIMAPTPNTDNETILMQQKASKEECGEKLMNFLRSSEHYTAATILAHFPHDSLYEERALLLGRLGQHQQALNIYVNTLCNLEEALNYCHFYYSPNGRDKEVYLILLKLLVLSSSEDNEYTDKDKKTEKFNVVMDLLQNYSHLFDLEQAIRLLPDGLPLHNLGNFLHGSFNRNLEEHHRKQIERGLSKSILNETQKRYLYEKKDHVILSESTICSVCRKRFTKHSAFAWFPDGKIAHFSCQKSGS